MIPNVSDRSRSVSVTLGLCTCSSDDEEQVPDKETDIGRIGIIRDVYTVILPYQPTPQPRLQTAIGAYIAHVKSSRPALSACDTDHRTHWLQARARTIHDRRDDRTCYATDPVQRRIAPRSLRRSRTGRTAASSMLDPRERKGVKKTRGTGSLAVFLLNVS